MNHQLDDCGELSRAEFRAGRVSWDYMSGDDERTYAGQEIPPGGRSGLRGPRAIGIAVMVSIGFWIFLAVVFAVLTLT